MSLFAAIQFYSAATFPIYIYLSMNMLLVARLNHVNNPVGTLSDLQSVYIFAIIQNPASKLYTQFLPTLSTPAFGFAKGAEMIST